MLEARFESLIGGDERRRSGAVYTPAYIVDELVASVFAMGEGTAQTFLDPACGAGGFLLGAANRLFLNGYLPEQIVEELLIGVDRDPLAVENCSIMLELWLLLHNASADRQQRISCRDSLTTDPAELLGSLGVPGGVSAIATNPPYVKLQTLERSYRAELLSIFPRFAQGSFSLSLLFTVRSLDLLNETGVAGFITQNNFFTSLAGRETRQYLQERRALRRICNFGHAQVFDGVSAYTCLLYVGSQKADAFAFASVPRPSALSLASASYSPIETADLNPRKWRLATTPHLENLRHIESMNVSLRDVATIRVGFATLKDSVFLLKVDPQSGLPLASGNLIEAEACRPCVKVAELRGRRSVPSPDRAVIFPYRRTGRKYVVIPEHELAELYPRTYEYLLTRRDELASREKGKPMAEGWYAWGRRQGFDAPGPKLLTKTFDARPSFPLDVSDALFCNGYSVSLRPDLSMNTTGELEVGDLQRILNSDVMEYYARLTSFQISGNFQCYQKNFIEPFGLPDPSTRLLDVLRLEDAQFEEALAEIYELDYKVIADYLAAERDDQL
jgi:hypothetical protein